MALSAKDSKYFINLKSEEISIKLLESLFAVKYNKPNRIMIPAQYKFSDVITLEKGECYCKEKTQTTIGRLIFNKVVIQPAFGDKFGYINDIIDSKNLKKLEDMISTALCDDVVTVEQMFVYFDSIQWLGSNFNHMVTPSFTHNTIAPVKSVIEERDKLLKKHMPAIKNGDILTAVQIENKLVDMAKKELANDPGMDLFNSGARGSFSNNYKNSTIMKGPTYNPVEGRFEVVDTCYTEGIKKDFIHLQANEIIAGAYPKAIGTADAGYLFKKLVAAFQTVVLDKRFSDCGSLFTIEVKLDNSNIDKFMYRYFKIGKKEDIITPKNKNSLIGKVVNMRSPMGCTGKKLCNKCAGDLPYKQGIENVGLLAAQISSDILNASMKKFHDSTQKMVEIDIEEMFI